MVKFTFACYYPAEEPLFIPVDSSLDVWVQAFTMQVHDYLKKFGYDVNLRDLRLCKVTTFLWQTVNLSTADGYSNSPRKRSLTAGSSMAPSPGTR